jgi:BMFP domain-containing protein YqiC
MQNDNKLFEDLSKVATAAMGTLAGANEFLHPFPRHAGKFAAGAGEISRDEFDAVKAMAATARAEVETLKAEIAALKAQITPVESAAKKSRKSGGADA